MAHLTGSPRAAPAPGSGPRRSLHILLVAESYPPSSWVGSVRPAALVRALRSAGHRVTVIRSAQYAAPPDGRPADDLGSVLTVQARENPIRMLARLRPMRAMARAAASGSSDQQSTGESVLQRLRRWLLSLALIPDDSQGFILPAAFAALDRNRADPVDLLITTGPPFSDHLIGLLLSRVLSVPWAAEFRDPWMPRRPWTTVHSPLAAWFEQGLENLVLRKSDLVVAVSASIAEGLDRKRLALGKSGRVLVALNGLPDLLPAVARPAGPIQVLHAGVLYLGRDPRPFLRAIARGVHAGSFGSAGVRVQFMGSSGGSFGGESVGQMAAELGIAESVEVLGQVPIEECRHLMARADALLLLAQDQPTQIPNKLYDYFAARRPIVAYADATGESAALIRRVGGHAMIPDDSPGHDEAVIAAVLASRQTPSGTGMDPAALEGLRTETQMAPLVDRLEQLVTARGATISPQSWPVPAIPRPAAPAVAAAPATPASQAPGASTSPAVSVIMPAWNVTPFIGEAVASVLGQSFRDWELIVVNDGSPDTPALERALAPFHGRITYLKQENLGPAVARNTGLAAARGEFVAFLDGDDAWLPEYLDTQLERLANDRLDMVYADAVLVGATPHRGRTFMDLAPSRGAVTVEALLAGRCNVITSGTVIRRELLLAVGAFPNRRALAEDFNTWLRVAQAGGRIGYQRRALLQYRVRPDSLGGDALLSARRGVEALHDARDLPLGDRERRVLDRQLVRARRRLDLEEAKALLVAGDEAGARRRVWLLVVRHPRPRLLLVLLGLHLWPGKLRRLMVQRRVVSVAGHPAAGPEANRTAG